jgi:hypothetical protein
MRDPQITQIGEDFGGIGGLTKVKRKGSGQNNPQITQISQIR